MSELILNPLYWKERLNEALSGHLHHSIFKCPLDRWLRIEEKHRKILKYYIGPNSSILDAGCGYGRLLTLLQKEWKGEYYGVDLSPDFIELAQAEHPHRAFAVCDFRDLSPLLFTKKFDWGVLISVRPMIRRHLGEVVWSRIEGELRRHCHHLLFLEYDEADEGEAK